MSANHQFRTKGVSLERMEELFGGVDAAEGRGLDEIMAAEKPVDQMVAMPDDVGKKGYGTTHIETNDR